MITLITILILCIITFSIIMATAKITIHYSCKHKKHYVAITASGYIIYCVVTFSLWAWGYDIIHKGVLVWM